MLALREGATIGIAAGKREDCFLALWSEYDVNFTILNGQNPKQYDWPVKGFPVHVHSFGATAPLILTLRDELFRAGAKQVRVYREDRRSDYLEIFFPNGEAVLKHV